jgi:hypothetical protein
VPPLTAQSIPGASPDWLVTVPAPSPPPETLRRNDAVVEALNTARTERFRSMRTVHVRAVPVQAFRHSLNVLPGSGVAVSVTVVPLA